MREIWASAVSAPTLVASTTRRPDSLMLAPTTSSSTADLDGHGLTGEERDVDRRVAAHDDAVGGDLLARPHHEPLADLQCLGRDLSAVLERGRGRAQVGQGPQRLARAQPGPTLEPTAQEDERDDDRRGLEVDGAVVDEQQGHDRPQVGRERAERHQRVHGRGVVAEVDEGGLVDRPAGHEHDRRGQRPGHPLPPLELQGRDHRDQRSAAPTGTPPGSGAPAGCAGPRAPRPHGRARPASRSRGPRPGGAGRRP